MTGLRFPWDIPGRGLPVRVRPGHGGAAAVGAPGRARRAGPARARGAVPGRRPARSGRAMTTDAGLRRQDGAGGLRRRGLRVRPPGRRQPRVPRAPAAVGPADAAARRRPRPAPARRGLRDRRVDRRAARRRAARARSWRSTPRRRCWPRPGPSRGRRPSASCTPGSRNWPPPGCAGPFDGILAAYLIRNLADPRRASSARCATCCGPAARWRCTSTRCGIRARARAVWHAVCWSVIIPSGRLATGDADAVPLPVAQRRRASTGRSASGGGCGEAGFTGVHSETDDRLAARRGAHVPGHRAGGRRGHRAGGRRRGPGERGRAAGTGARSGTGLRTARRTRACCPGGRTRSSSAPASRAWPPRRAGRARRAGDAGRARAVPRWPGGRLGGTSARGARRLGLTATGPACR